MKILLVLLVYAVALSIALGRAGYRSQAVPSKGPPRKRPTRILIVGATGGTGRELVAQALARDYTVTALARDPAKLGIDHPRLTVVEGDVLDEDSVAAAVAGQEAVVSALGHKRFFYPTRILSRGTQNVLGAMAAHGVGRFVGLTALGIGDSAGRMGLYYTLFTIPVILPFYFWDKTRQERIIARSPVDWTIVRPGVLTNGKRRGRVSHGAHVGSFLWTVRVPRADVAAFALDQLEADDYRHAAPGVA